MAAYRWTCNLCGKVCSSDKSRANHMRNYWKECNDPSRCDNQIDPVHSDVHVNVPVIPAPVASSSLLALARRVPSNWIEVEARAAYTITDTGRAPPPGVRTLTGQLGLVYTGNSRLVFCRFLEPVSKHARVQHQGDR